MVTGIGEESGGSGKILPGTNNPADALTKYLAKSLVEGYLGETGHWVREGRAEKGLELQRLGGERQGSDDDATITDGRPWRRSSEATSKAAVDEKGKAKESKKVDMDRNRPNERALRLIPPSQGGEGCKTCRAAGYFLS